MTARGYLAGTRAVRTGSCELLRCHAHAPVPEYKRIEPPAAGCRTARGGQQ